MAENKMLIDATHPEETRVVVLREGRVAEFDYESAARKLLRGSIFLAKITRVEPSLQAAFVDYGGNRHGFLAFNEIHPDYYQIPHADRQALLEAQSAQRADDDDRDDERFDAELDEASDDASNGPSPTDDLEVAEVAEVAANDDAVVGDADPAIEASAIDVTDLLPPEPGDVEPGNAGSHDVIDLALANVDPATTVVVEDAERHEPDATEHDILDIAVAGNEPAKQDTAGTASDDVTGDDALTSGADEDADGQSDKPSGPKTIAAAIEPDERIVSDVVEPAQGDDASDDATSVDSPIEGKTPTVDAIVVLDDAASSADVTEPADDNDADTVAEQSDADRESNDDDDGMTDDAMDQVASERTHTVGTVASAVPALEARAPADDDDDDRDGDDDDVEAPVDDVGEADALEEVPTRPRRRIRNYKIQEVIKRRQVVLVQVVKEERGNKGAALTTYLSLAGRYTVLMPNTARGGGISRKITNLQDRKRLKAIAQELDVPEGMGLIIRTAGAARTKQEIKRDFEYLLRLWENVRDLTLQSTAPSLVYEEGDLIKRSIRDLYSKDVEQVLVAGEAAHKEAKSFMRMLMPSHAKNVIKYEDPQPLFARYRIEQQLNAMFSPFVQLRSGGYLVINQTEALVAVDVNSGKSTRKFSIEETALNTNLEAAEELSRQLKLRDLAGLIVIDFIDMEEKRNNRAVERRLKECLRDDRARIQVGRISHFGLLEMSRQRLRTGVLEGSTMPCHHCQGTGIIRSTESVALAVLRALEDQLMAGPARSLTAQCSRDVAMYLLNHKRGFVQEIEERYSVTIHVEASDAQQGADFLIDRMAGAGSPPSRRSERAAVNVQTGFSDAGEEREETRETEGDERRSRRRRRRRGRRSEGGEAEANGATDDQATADAVQAAPEDVSADAEERASNGESEERGSRRRRRGRRGGRRNRGDGNGAVQDVAAPGAPQPEIAAVADDTWNDGNGETATDVTADEPPQATSPVADNEPELVVAAVDELQSTEPEAASKHQDEIDGPDTGSEFSQQSDEPATQSASQEAPETETKPDDVQQTLVDAVDEPSMPRSEPVSSEPVLERVVITPEADSAGPADAELTEKPARKGWWQRNFGS